MLIKCITVLLLGLACALDLAHATDLTTRPNPAEMTSLPVYCQVRLNGLGKPEFKVWEGKIGKNFEDIHHYCFGLNWMSRSLRTGSAQDRGYYLTQAIGNFDYVVRAEKPDFNPEIRAEVYLGRGEAYKLMGRPGEALSDFTKALTINPKMLRAYLLLADLQVSGKEKADALETITRGLRQNPDSKTLQRKYLELGGKKPFPEPQVEKAEEPKSPQQAALPPAAAQGVADAPAAPAHKPETDAPPMEQHIGTPKNPYCRFCPPE